MGIKLPPVPQMAKLRALIDGFARPGYCARTRNRLCHPASELMGMGRPAGQWRGTESERAAVPALTMVAAQRFAATPTGSCDPAPNGPEPTGTVVQSAQRLDPPFVPLATAARSSSALATDTPTRSCPAQCRAHLACPVARHDTR